jgi:hypothetical protein
MQRLRAKPFGKDLGASAIPVTATFPKRFLKLSLMNVFLFQGILRWLDVHRGIVLRKEGNYD